MLIATIIFIQLLFPSCTYLRLKFYQLLHCDHKTGNNYKNNPFFGHIYRNMTTLEAQIAENWHCILALGQSIVYFPCCPYDLGSLT